MIRTLALAAAMGLGLACAAPPPPARAQAQPEAPGAAPPRGGTELSPAQRRLPQERRRSDPLRAFDLDRDGALNLAETKSAAAKRYDDLNPDLDDAMTRKEARRRELPASTFREADADRSGAVDKAEWLALVERRFEAADGDRDGAVSRAELGSEQGRTLMRFLRRPPGALPDRGAGGRS